VNEPRKHRLFFALEPDDGVRSAVGRVQHALRLDARPVPAANFHVTLAFLGMQNSAVIPVVCDVASRLAFPPCEVTLGSLGCFKRAGVLWLGASEVPGALQRFQQDLVDSLLEAAVGYDRKPWKFHLTLYRKMRKPAPTIKPVAIRWPLNSFSLIESISVRSGVEYHRIGHWKAAGQG
jgi:2'-5' RNA ligase